MKKRIFSLFLSIIIALSLSVASFADETGSSSETSTYSEASSSDETSYSSETVNSEEGQTSEAAEGDSSETEENTETEQINENEENEINENEINENEINENEVNNTTAPEQGVESNNMGSQPSGGGGGGSFQSPPENESQVENEILEFVAKEGYFYKKVGNGYVEYPTKTKINIDPFGIKNDKTIYSDTYEIKNYSDEQVSVDLDMVVLSVKEGININVVDEMFEDIEITNSDRVYIAVQFSNGLIVPLTEEALSYPKALIMEPAVFDENGEFVEVSENGCITFEYIGNIELCDARVRNGDMTSLISINCAAVVPEEETPIIEQGAAGGAGAGTGNINNILETQEEETVEGETSEGEAVEGETSEGETVEEETTYTYETENAQNENNSSEDNSSEDGSSESSSNEDSPSENNSSENVNNTE